MAKKNKNQHSCSFCGRTEDLVEKMISGEDAFICDKCVALCMKIVNQKPPLNPETDLNINILKPREIKARLDEYVIGQDEAKKTIAVAVYNHYKRIIDLAQEEQEIEISKSNVLLLGPTGSGKTLIAKTLARILDVPFAIADATALTEAGYVGEDVENILLRLIQEADYDIKKAEMGIIYIDEIDKIGRTTSNVSITRDVSGEGVQQALLKIVEGTVANVPPKGGRKHPNQEYIKFNTENILFIAGGAFVGLEKNIAKRLGKGVIGFNAGKKDVVEHDKKSLLLSKVEPSDLISFGMIPEFIGRFNCLVNSNDLMLEDLVEILTGPKNALIRQFKHMFKKEGVELHFTQGALLKIAEKAENAGTGARALRMILEKIMRDLMYDIPSEHGILEVHIDEGVIVDGKHPDIKREEVGLE